jgi:hypothetical protein
MNELDNWGLDADLAKAYLDAIKIQDSGALMVVGSVQGSRCTEGCNQANS